MYLMKKQKLILLLTLTVVSMIVSLSSCNDEPGSGKNDLVGTWYYYDDGEIYFDEYVVFEKNGTYHSSYGDSGKYKYNPSSSTITYYEEDNEFEESIVFVTADKIILDGEYYVRQ